ncbi:MAG: hypothetical protein ACTSX6_06475 [Candidatus Heimdallarchaeaceae archaeon]
MKAQLKIVDTIGILGTILMIILFFTQVFPKMLDLIVEAFSKTSSEAVARQLAAFMTISGASPHRITIKYVPTELVEYDVSGKDRVLSVYAKYKVPYVKKVSSSQPYATPFEDFEFKDVNSFTITKTFENGESHYSISAEKE